MQIERRNSFQFSGHTVKIKDRRIFHDFCNFFYDIQFKIYLVKYNTELLYQLNKFSLTPLTEATFANFANSILGLH